MADTAPTGFSKRIADEVLAILESNDPDTQADGKKSKLEELLSDSQINKCFSRYKSNLFFRKWIFKQQLEATLKRDRDLAGRVYKLLDLPAPFEIVLERELSEIANARTLRARDLHFEFKDNTAPKPDELVGLALSGGGIRSATFNLGVLQALAKLQLLRSIDYLSTVSGGGYIGSWLAALIKREGFAEAVKWLRPDWKEHPDSGEDHRKHSAPQIDFLRDYSNYLTPQLGFFSADTWTMVATWVRNFLLNLTILVLAASAVLLLPRLFVSWSHMGCRLCYLLAAVGLLLVAIVMIGMNLKLITRGAKARREEYPWYSRQKFIQWTVAIPTLLAAWLGSCWLWHESQAGRTSWLYGWHCWKWALVGALITFVIWTVAWIVSLICKRRKSSAGTSPEEVEAEKAKSSSWLPIILASLAEGAVGGLLFFGLYHLYRGLNTAGFPGIDVHFVAWGTGLVAGIFGLMAVVQIGLMGKPFFDEKREWWSRASAWVTIYCLAWTAIFAIALYGPLIIQWAGYEIKGVVTLAWLANTITGVLAAKSSKNGGNGPANWFGFLVKVAPYVFVVGLFALLSFGIYSVLPHQAPGAEERPVAIHIDLSWKKGGGGESTSVTTSEKMDYSFHDQALAYWRSSVWSGPKGPESTPRYPNESKQPLSPWWILAILGGCAGAALLLSWRVDINEFSLHLFYRNRLVRCYLGASHQGPGWEEAKRVGKAEKCDRNPNPFTGFDPADNIRLAQLSQTACLDKKKGEKRYIGPYPILNATLNVTHGKRLAWQERKAESFVFTPCYCGYRVKPNQDPRVKKWKNGPPVEKAGYRPTENYLYSKIDSPNSPGGPYVGTAMGISGAALSPNMGYLSSPALAFLMTVFDVRTGWWAGNTRHRKTWKRRGPRLGILYLLLELFGTTDDQRGYVYLSDGGHFENLGIYELVHRHCRLIVASDAGEDAKYQFEGLGNAIRKCREDFGVDIEIDAHNLHPTGEPKVSKSHCAVGVIRYDKVSEKEKPGILIYIKASLTGDEPVDVLEYQSKHEDFPHDTTADQWFSESQFESYRKLGQHVVEQLVKKNSKLHQTTPVRNLFEMDAWREKDATQLEKFLTEKTAGV